MAKIQMGPQTLAFPMPAFLIGATVDNKPNFMTAAWAGVAAGVPPAITVAIQHHRYTNKGIKQNYTFTVNIPSANMVKETDYCGITPGAKVNKVDICQFKVFYGKLENAPMIEQCPINLECKVIHMLDLGSHNLIVGRIEETYISDDCLTEGKPDINKIKPFGYARDTAPKYVAFQEVIAEAFSIGKELKDKE